jgi:hypothetical protein
MDDYPQLVSGLIKDTSTEKKRHRDTVTRYIMMTNQGGGTIVTNNNKIDER